MIIGVPVETYPNDHRVTLAPAVLPALTKMKLEVLLEPSAGMRAGFPDAAYAEKGAQMAADRDEVFSKSQILPLFHLRDEMLTSFHPGHSVVGLLNPLGDPGKIKRLAERGVTAFALELLPRITRAQSMDVLSSMATIAGYKAVLIAANRLDKMLPLLMTAAGTITPARVFIVGAGVAGLQAIATARRLGAVVRAYDVRPAVKEQVQSLGAKFLELELTTKEAEGAGGYARAMDEEFYQRQREAMSAAVAESDIVITTAAIPGKKAPVLITGEMVKGMRPGSVLVDLAAETGGNCELTKAGESQLVHDVHILGPVNLPAQVPLDASQMFARNVTAFLQNLVKDGEIQINMDDDIIRETLVTREGQVVNPRVKELLSE